MLWGGAEGVAGVEGAEGVAGVVGMGEETTMDMARRATTTTMAPCVVAPRNAPRDTTSAQRAARVCLLVPLLLFPLSLHLYAHSQHLPALFISSSTWIRVPVNVLSMLSSSLGYPPFLQYLVKILMRLDVQALGVQALGVLVAQAEVRPAAGQAEMWRLQC